MPKEPPRPYYIRKEDAKAINAAAKTLEWEQELHANFPEAIPESNVSRAKRELDQAKFERVLHAKLDRVAAELQADERNRIHGLLNAKRSIASMTIIDQ